MSTQQRNAQNQWNRMWLDPLRQLGGMVSGQPGSQAQRASAQRNNMEAATAGRPIPLREARLGAEVPGGAAYGARLNGRQVLVQPGAAGSGALNAGGVNFAGQTLFPAKRGSDVVWVPRSGSKPTAIEQGYGIGATQAAVVDPGSAQVPVVTPPVRARNEALNTASQQAGGANLSQPLVPTEAQAAAREYAAARQGNPLAELPELIDQRSQGYGQRADIQAWMEANKNAPKDANGMNIVDRFLARQRKEPTAVQEMPAGAKLMGGDGSEEGSVAYDAERLAAYEQGGAGQRSVDEAIAGFRGRDLQANPLINQALTPEGQAQAYQAGMNGMELVPQATAQAGNLAFSALPQANAAQGRMDFAKTLQLTESSELGDLLNRYKGMAGQLNAGKLNTVFRGSRG